MQDRMMELQQLDRAQRDGAASKDQWIRSIPPETGRLLALLAASAPSGTVAELGTGAGYSTLWLILALRTRVPVPRLITLERDPVKVERARETFECCGVSDLISLQIGDAATELPKLGPLAFVFVDHGPPRYEACRESLICGLAPGGLMVVDNILSHPEICQPFVSALEADQRVDCTVLPVGKGLLLARRVG